jgi:hypothetical protein
MRTKVRKRAGRWFVAVVDDAGRELGHGGYRTRAETRRAAAALLADAARGRYVTPAKLTLGAYLLGEWLPSRETADLSETTRDTDRTVVEAWLVPWIGEVPLQKLSARDLDRLYRELRARGGRNGRPLRGKSVRNAHVTLHKALHDAVRRGHLLVNVADAVDRRRATTAWSGRRGAGTMYARSSTWPRATGCTRFGGWPSRPD